jgi:hypothetical protein
MLALPLNRSVCANNKAKHSVPYWVVRGKLKLKAEWPNDHTENRQIFLSSRH